MDNIILFSRGDPAYHTFSILASAWTAGGRLFFAAKQVIDDDPADANALIQGNWGDSAVSDVIINGLAYKQYACTFPPSATSSIVSNGAPSADYLGEFQYVPVSGYPVTAPAVGSKFDAQLWFDVKIKTTV